MHEHQYQLVLEFDESTVRSDDCRQLYDSLATAFEDDSKVLVDGFDSGGGYFNLFIHTSTPLETFCVAKTIVDQECPGVVFRSGYRDFTLCGYTPVHPPGLMQFKLR